MIDVAMIDDDFSFGALLQSFRKRVHLTQQELAEAIGINRRTLIRWEQGDFLPESKTLLLDLARHLKLGDQESRRLLEASLTALSPYWFVPFPRNPFFTGREGILEELHAQLGVAEAVALTHSSALHGLGGVGKTQIALEYAYRHALEYSAVFWIGAETEEQITTSLLHVAGVLQLPEQTDKDQQQVIVAVQRWLATHQHWLLIWDNIEDLTLLDHFLPSTRSGAILLTTRCQALGTFARGLDLSPMEPQEGMLFLLRRAKILDVQAPCDQIRQLAAQAPAQYAAAAELVSALGGLPLALDQAGAYIEETGCEFSDYLQRYTQQRTQVLDRRGAFSTDHPHSVASTFLLACQQVTQRKPDALELLYFCAWLSPDAIPEELFLALPTCSEPVLGPVAADRFQFDQALRVLLSLSLVRRHPESQMLSMHRLVQVVLRETMNEQERTRWLLRPLQVLAHLFPEVNALSSNEVWSQCERLLPHVLAVAAAHTDGPGTQEVAVVLRKAADYLCERGQYKQAEPLYERVLTICHQKLGSDHPLVIGVLNGLACLFLEQGKFERGEEACQHALLLQTRAGRSASPEALTSLILLADLRGRQGKYPEAESLFQQALSLAEQLFGPEHPRQIDPLSLLGLLYWRQGKYTEAEPLLQQALFIGEQTFGSAHLQLTAPLTNLGLLRWKQGHYTEAEQFFCRAIQICEQVFGETHHMLAYILTGLAIIYHAQNKLAQAEMQFQRVLQIREQTLGTDHPLVAVALNNLAEFSVEQGKYEQAERMYQRSIALYEQRGAAEPSSLAYPLHGLAALYARQGRRAQAEALYQRALQLWEQVGEDPATIALALGDLAQLYMGQEKYEDAERLYQRVLSLRMQSSGEHHLETAQTLYDFAILQHKQDKRDEACSLAQQACAIRCELLGAVHPTTITAQALIDQIRQEQASTPDEAVVARERAERSRLRKMQYAGETALLPHESAGRSLSENEVLQEFLDACCELHPHAWCRVDELRHAYEQWTASAQKRVPLSRRAFVEQIQARGCRADRTSSARIWRGIKLRDQTT